MRWILTSSAVLVFALLSRLLAGVLAAAVPIVNDSGSRVSPLHELAGGDYLSYKSSASRGLGVLAEPLRMWWQQGSISEWLLQGQIAGPLFPLLIGLLDYPNRPLLLPSLFLFGSALVTYGWACYYRNAGVGVLWQYALLGMPLLVYYGLFIGTDLPFAVVFFLLFLALRDGRPSESQYSWIIVLLALALLLRPNALALLPPVAWAIVRAGRLSAHAIAVLALLVVLGSYFTLYYAPYLFGYMSGSRGITYWGYEQSEFARGLFDQLPDWLDRPLSILLLLISKILYMTGLRPSYSDVPFMYVFLRGVTSIWLLPGLVRALWKGTAFERLLVACFILPILLGASQERYIVPIAPLLFLHGVLFWRKLLVWQSRPAIAS